MDFRFADESDLPALLALINDAFRVEAYFIRGDRVTPERLREHFDAGRFLVGEEDQRIGGCVYVELHGKRAYLGLLSVDPGRQKNGLGRGLVGAAEEFAREMGARVIDLTVVNLREALPPWYARLGYSVIGEEPIYEHMVPRILQHCHFIRMSKPLG